jgi:glucokinase
MTPDPNALALAVDLGGTWLRLALVRPDGTILAKVRLATPDAGRPASVIAAIAGQRRAWTGTQPVIGVGAAVPGPVDAGSGLVFSPPNVVGWGTYPLAAELEAELSLPVWLNNDANLAALGEARFGAGRGPDPLVYLTISTGVGGGIVLGNRVYVGAHGLAGELGHVIVQPGGPACRAGHAGCLEALASGTAVARRATEALAVAPATTTIGQYVAPGAKPTAADVARAAEAGDALARALFADAGTALGLAIGGVLNTLDPARVVLGGGLAGSWKLWAPAMHEAVTSVVMAQAARAIQIVPAALGDDAGLLGAAAYAFDQAGYAAPRRPVAGACDRAELE